MTTDCPSPFQPPLDPSFVEMSEEEISRLRADILRHMEGLGLPSWAGTNYSSDMSKSGIRAMHSLQRQEVLLREMATLSRKLERLIPHFANGREVKPEAITPQLELVKTDESSGDLFRLATLLWSVPVSKGYGRRLRYLVRDGNNGKLIGIFGLTDPVFNLRARDEWIGWNVEQRRSNLVHVMDAYVVGAVPPYSQILGGKLVAAMIGSAEVAQMVALKYGETQGIISARRKSPRLALVTVTSALGRSSIYNRLRLRATYSERMNRTLIEFVKLGWTEGYGHFHLSESLFHRLRQLLIQKGHRYANAYQYGQGPNWRMRMSRVGLSMLGLDPDLLRHGVAREIYAVPLATDFREFLCGRVEDAHLDRPSTCEIGAAALSRWVLPRSERDPSFQTFERSEIVPQLGLTCPT